MFKIFLALLVITAEVTAKDDICVGSLDHCRIGNPPDNFPQTEEEYKNGCDFAISYFECTLDYHQKCSESERLAHTQRKLLEVAREMCDEDSLLYGVIVQNLKCYDRVLKETREKCDVDTERIPKIAESLSEDGLVTLPEEEFQRYHVYSCVQELMLMACFASNFEDKCGEEAANAFVEITLKLNEAQMQCEDADILLEKLVRRYQLENQQSSNIVDLLSKRK